jgi:hypothetical protein
MIWFDIDFKYWTSGLIKKLEVNKEIWELGLNLDDFGT